MRSRRFTLMSLMPLFLLGSEMTQYAVSPFDLNAFLGTWYEIARLDHRFERGLEDVTATYTLRDDGKVRVLNRGFKASKDRWSSATGKATFQGDTHVGALKVSFFGPFYAGYHVVWLDPEYRYMLVAGDNTRYLWLMAREPELPDTVRAAMLQRAQELGYATQDLIWVTHH